MDIFDRLHKTISISPLAKKIIDTPQFQRLRRIKQLGCANFVYPCATHTRFEHSIGVAYLGKKMIRHFQQNQPELNISDQQVELIFLGGLLHDIGHAPYSHAFEHLTQEKHEQWSQEITKNLTKKLLKPQEQQTLLNIITGDGSGWMFEIIANKITGFDVDKLDYIVRDSMMIGFNVNVDLDRFIKNARIINGSISYNEKLYDDIFEIFRMRYILHKKVYNHHAVLGIEYLILDLLKDLQATKNDDDSIIYQQKDHVLLSRLETRSHYKKMESFLGPTLKSAFELAPYLKNWQRKVDWVLVQREIGFGGSEHPMKTLSFYNKRNLPVKRAFMPSCNVSEVKSEYLSILLLK